MPFLDAIHIFFEPCVTLDVRTRLLTKSVFDREWDMTLEYVLHQPGLNAAYTSSLSLQHDLWVFLVWETEDDRHRFYKQTTGFGFVTDHLAKPPSVFLFGYAIYNELETAPDWTADVITPEIEDGEAWNYQPNAGGSQTLQLLNGHLFVARQEKDTTAQLYDGNDFDYAIIALTKTVDLEGEEDTRHGLQWSRYAIELHKCEQNVYSKTVIVEAPTSIAELIEKEPWEYGLLSPDESKYSDTAYPMNLTFRPMSTLSKAEKFQPDHKDRSTARAETTDEYAMCIIEFTISPHYVSSGASLIDDLRFKAKLEDGADGLRELSVLIDARSPDTIKFLTVWQGMSQLATWWDFLGSVCNSRWSWWTSSVPGLPNLCWEETSLTPDKQDWQEADKILEGVMFTFTDPLTPAEQKASETRIQDLMNTMSSCWSGDVDTSPVVHAEDPIWIDAQGKMPQCLLFLAWEGVEQREAWLRNFMAQDFTWAGYMAYALKKICYTIHSIDYKMEKIYSGHLDPATSPNKQNQDEGDDSDRDMGF